jgi:transposase
VCVCAVGLFIRTRSITENQCTFRREWNQQDAPSPNAIRRWVRQWREEGSVTCKKPPGRQSSVRTPDSIARETLQAVMRSFLTSVHLCIEEGGGHKK